MPQVSTIADWAPLVGVSFFTRLFSALRSTWVMVVVDNPLSWKLGFRGQNEQDDVEGAYYIFSVRPGLSSPVQNGLVLTLDER